MPEGACSAFRVRSEARDKLGRTITVAVSLTTSDVWNASEGKLMLVTGSENDCSIQLNWEMRKISCLLPRSAAEPQVSASSVTCCSLGPVPPGAPFLILMGESDSLYAFNFSKASCARLAAGLLAT